VGNFDKESYACGEHDTPKISGVDFAPLPS